MFVVGKKVSMHLSTHMPTPCGHAHAENQPGDQGRHGVFMCTRPMIAF